MTRGSDSLTERTTRAAQWRFSGSAIAAMSQLAVGVLLARLLRPADFGVMALASVIIGFARPLCDLGVGRALVQRASVTERHIRTAFTFSLLLGTGAAGILVVAAPVVASSMNDSRVGSVLRLLAIGFAVQGAAVVSGALLIRDLDFRRQFFIEIASYLVGYAAVSVGLALLGYGIWSLAWGNLVQTVVATGAQLTVVRHRMRPMLAMRELRDLLHFGLGSSAIAVVNSVALNGDNFVVGRWAGAASLGLYTRAYTLMNLPYTYGSSVVSSVLFPAFAQAQSEPARLERAYLTLIQLTAMIAASAMVTLGIVAPHLVRSVYGPRWISTVLPLQILCLAGYFRALYHLGGIVAQSLGRVYGELWRQVLYAGLVVLGAFLGLRYGLPGVAAGVGVAILYMFVATSQLSLSATHTSWAAYLRVQRGAVVTAAFTGGIAFSVRFILEARGASSAVITGAVLAGAALPFAAGMLWTLGDPRFEVLRSRLPPFCNRLVAQVGKWRHPSEANATSAGD